MSCTQRSYSGRSYSYRPAPVEEGKESEADIAELSRRGEGIATIHGFFIFVPNTKPGDHIKFKATRAARRYATAEVVT